MTVWHLGWRVVWLCGHFVERRLVNLSVCLFVQNFVSSKLHFVDKCFVEHVVMFPSYLLDKTLCLFINHLLSLSFAQNVILLKNIALFWLEMFWHGIFLMLHLLMFVFCCHVTYCACQMVSMLTCLLSTCHFANMPFCQHVILSICHFVRMPFYQHITLSICHLVNKSFCQQVILSTCHFVNMSFCQHVILSTCHFVNMPFCQHAILSLCHFI